MKLWNFTANPLQQSRRGKIGLPAREKMSIINRDYSVNERENRIYVSIRVEYLLIYRCHTYRHFL